LFDGTIEAEQFHDFCGMIGRGILSKMLGQAIGFG
jgi:hypothetical protein